MSVTRRSGPTLAAATAIARETALVVVLAAFATPVLAQHLHTNHRWRSCAIVLDSSLTQAAFHQFTGELGVVSYFRPMASAAPLGRGHFEIGLVNNGSRINDADAAWNDTFSHPDSTHWLFEGSALFLPGLVARGGITDRIDVGAYYTQNFDANYGVMGGQLQYNLVNDPERKLSASGRASVVRLFGPEDVGASTYGLDFVVSRELSRFAPYVGLSGYLARAHETTTKVDLRDENVFGAQATVGVAARVSILRIGTEVTLSRVTAMSMKVAFAR